MNNFFLRPWARGPVFGADEEGGGGGGGDEEKAPNLDGVNPQGPTYTPPPVSTDRSFLENVGDAFSGVGNTVYDFMNPLSPTGTVGGDVSAGLGGLNRAAKTGIETAYSGADLFEDTYGNVVESITGKRPAASTQYYADERARETGIGSGLIPTPERQGGPQYFDAFGTPVGSAEGIRRADKLREDAALRAGRTAQVQRDKQANIDLVSELGGDNVSAVDRGMYQLGTLIPEVGSAALDFFGRPVDQGGSLLPSSTSQNLTQAGIDKKVAGDVVFDNLDAETQRALTSDLSVRDPNALYQQVMQAAPSAIASLIPATGGLTKTAAGTGAALFGGESAIDRDAVLDKAYLDGSLQKSPAYQSIARDYGGNNDLALAAAKKSANVDNIVSDVLSGAAIGAAQAKLGPGLGRQFFGEGLSEGVLEQQLMAENIDRQFDPTEEFGIGANPTMQQMINEGVVAGILGEGVSSSGAPVITAPNTSGTIENTGTSLTTPLNTGIASLQPESNQGPLVGELMKDNVLRAPRKGFRGLNTAPMEDAVILTEEQLNPRGGRLNDPFATIPGYFNTGLETETNQGQFNPRGGRLNDPFANIPGYFATPANEFAGTETLANQDIANNLANRTSPNPNDLVGTNVQEEFNFQRPPDMSTIFDPAAELGPAFTDPAVAAARQAQEARLNALAAAARDASTGGAQQRAAFPDLAPSGETNPLVNQIIAARSAGLAPGPDASFTARDTPITPEQTFENQLKGVRTARAFTPPTSMETNQNLFPVSNVLPSNQQGPTYTPPARRQRGPDQTSERMLAKNQVPTTLENVMQQLVLEQNVNPLTGEILNPAPVAFVAPTVKTGTTIEGTVNPPTTAVLETNQNLMPTVQTTVIPPEDDGPVIDIPTFPETTGGDDDDDNIPPDDGGNCPPGYELKLINGMYVCVPIDQVEDEVEEEEETPAVTYGRPGIGVYYQPRTVAPITPYVLNPNEVV